MERIFILGQIVFFSFNLFSQNLVINPDFEDIIQHKGDLSIYRDSFYARSWFQPTDCSIDIYQNEKFPYNDNINLDAHSKFETNVLNGKYCIGLFFLEFMGQMEHLTGSLSSELKAGRKYSVSFYIRMYPTKTPFVPKGIGYKFSNDSVIFKNVTEFDDRGKGKPSPFYDYLFANHKVYADYEIDEYILDTNWIKYSSIYTAKGGERFITLGRFSYKDDEKLIKEFKKNRTNPWKEKMIKYIKSDKSSVCKRFFDKNKNLDVEHYNYYYLDKVDVTPIEDLSTKIDETLNKSILDSTFIKLIEPFIYIDLDPSTMTPSEKVISIDKGFIGEMTMNLGVKLNSFEKYVLQFDKNKSITIINTNNNKAGFGYYKYSFKYPAKKLRRKPLKIFVEKVTNEEILSLKNRSKKVTEIDTKNFKGVLLE
ncbi:MAG: peptidoglycan-binding protein ArfA [Bacteroidota bacterium]|jgi:hypothetical protein